MGNRWSSDSWRKGGGFFPERGLFEFGNGNKACPSLVIPLVGVRAGGIRIIRLGGIIVF
jgi:hypothetical protein